MDRDEKNAIIARIATSVIFGCSFIFSKEALEYASTVQLLSYRFLVAAILLCLLKKLKLIQINVDMKSIRQIKPLLLLSVFQPITGYSFEMEGVERLTSAESGILLSLVPIIVTVMGNWYLSEKPNLKQLFFIVISFVGVLFILIIKDSSFENVSYVGSACLIIAAFCSSVYSIMSRKVSTEFSYEEITYVMMISGAFFFNAIHFTQCLISRSFITYIELFQNSSLWIPALYLGVGSSVLGFLMTNFSLSKLTAFRVAVFNNLATVISIIAGVVIRKEPFTVLQIIGAVMITIGVWGVNYYTGKSADKAD